MQQSSQFQDQTRQQALLLSDDIIHFSHKLSVNVRNSKAIAKRYSNNVLQKHVQQNGKNKQGSLNMGKIFRNMNQEMRGSATAPNVAANLHGSAQSLRAKESGRSEVFGVRNKRYPPRNISQDSHGHKTSMHMRGKSMQQNLFKASDDKKHEILPQKQPHIELLHSLNLKHINISGVESWLNEALIEASPKHIFDPCVTNAAIKLYCIDRSSLISLGLSPPTILRLYRSLFVYSIGFNNLLKDICQGKMSIRTSIWKVYAVLLEYCSGGKFEMTIGQLERDHTDKVQKMKSIIEERQKMIQNSDEINEQKNAKFFKELREVRQSNHTLSEERKTLLNDYYETEQAFNQEILLRLKFENRINEVHSIYEELRYKNQHLHQSYQLQLENCKKYMQMVDSLKSEHLQINAQLNQQLHSNADLSSDHRIARQAVISLKRDLQNAQYCNETLTIANEQLKNTNKQLNKQFQQFEIRLSSQKRIEQSLNASLKLKSAQLQKQLQQNVKLNQTIVNQQQSIDRLVFQQKEIGPLLSAAKVETDTVKRKYDQLFDSKKAAAQNYSVLQGKLREKQIELEVALNGNEQHLQDLQVCHQSIKLMKSHNIELEQALRQSQLAMEPLQQLIQQKTLKQIEQEEKIRELSMTVNEQSAKLKNLRSTVMFSEERLRSEAETAAVKYQSLQKEKQLLNNKYEQMREEQNRLLDQFFQSKQEHVEATKQLKNEKFERVNLGVRFKQALTVMEEGNLHIKQLNIRISEISDVVNQQKIKLRQTISIHEQRVKQLTTEIAFWKSELHKLNQSYSHVKNYVNPMSYEDLYSSYLALEHRLNELNLKYEQKLKVIEQIQVHEKGPSVPSNYQQLQDNYRGQQQAIGISMQQQKQQYEFVQDKLAYAGEKTADLQRHVDQLERQKSVMQKERYQHLQTINQRNQLIQGLNQKIERLLLNQKEGSELDSGKQRGLEREQRHASLNQRLNQSRSAEGHSQHINTNSINAVYKPAMPRSDVGTQTLKYPPHSIALQDHHTPIKEEAEREEEQDMQAEQAVEAKQAKQSKAAKYTQSHKSSQTLTPKQQNIRKRLSGAYLYYNR